MPRADRERKSRGFVILFGSLALMLFVRRSERSKDNEPFEVEVEIVPATHENILKLFAEDSGEGGPARLRDIPSAPDGEIHGRLLDENGKPVAWATIACGAIIQLAPF